MQKSTDGLDRRGNPSDSKNNDFRSSRWITSQRLKLLSLFLIFVIPVFGGPPPGYYDTAIGKSGVELRDALHEIINDHISFPYSGGATNTSDALKRLDEDPADTNNVFLLYAQRSEPKDTFGLTTGWNREHVWPNSYGLDDVRPAYTDLFNLRAEDANVNSSRGNKYYDVSDPSANGYKEPAHVEAPLTSTDFDSWEPPDGVRAILPASFFTWTCATRAHEQMNLT